MKPPRKRPYRPMSSNPERTGRYHFRGLLVAAIVVLIVALLEAFGVELPAWPAR